MLLLCGLAVLSAFLYKHSHFLHDDALITLRYALNFAQTGLPQWNPGEWVEGYTSLLHVVVLGGFIKIGTEPINALQLTNGIAALGLLALTTYVTGIIAPKSPLFRLATIVSVAASPSLAIWILGGLETPVVATFLMAGLTCLVAYIHTPKTRFILLATLAFSCAILTRLDSAVFITGTGLGFVFAARAPFIRNFFMATCFVGIPAVVAFVQMAIRLSVYGETFPLTFYAKTDLSTVFRMKNGAIYLFESTLDNPLPIIAMFALLLALLLKTRSATAKLIAGPILLHLCYVIWSGGDHMPAERILLVLIAPMAVVILAVAVELPDPRRTMLLAITTAASLIFATSKDPEPMDDAAFIGGIIGRHIATEWPQDITIALNTAGATPYFATQNRTFIDMLGLNDPIIAKRENTPIYTIEQMWPGHSKGDGPYVLSRKPDRIIIGAAEGQNADQAWFLSGYEMNRLPEFHRCYTQHTEHVSYNADVAAKGTKRANPLPFKFYVRTCD